MSIIKCPECSGEVSTKALICPHCGYTVGGTTLAGYEYRSRTRLFGIPLVHVVFGCGINPLTGRVRPAKGIIAVGHISIGVIAVGGFALGPISIGGLAIGLLAIGGCALGAILAIGGMALGFIAIGAVAIGYYSFGALVFGVHPLGANQQDNQALVFFKKLLGKWIEKFSNK